VGFFENMGPWLSEHSVMIGTVLAAIVEVVFRLWPSNKIRSLLSYTGRILVALSKLIFAISDILSKMIPDRKPEKLEIPK